MNLQIHRQDLGGPAGRVWLVGAGPGDPELLTVRALRVLQQAQVVLHDALISAPILALVPATALCLDVGKVGGGPSTSQAEINALLLVHAQAGRRVVRLKGGDPFVFGRGFEEVIALQEAGVPVEVVPGITSAVAVPAAAGIPVTHRGAATHVTFLTATGAGDDDALRTQWGHLSQAGGTLVFLMGLRRLEAIATTLVGAGASPERPAAVVSKGTTPDQRVVVGTLATIAALVDAAGLPSPALLVVGEVVALREQWPSLLSVLDCESERPAWA